MADLFELHNPDNFFKINGVEYRLYDPVHKDKVMFQKENDELNSKKDSMSTEELTEALYVSNKKSIKLYLRDIPDDVLDSLGQGSQLAILDKILELLPTKFGAVVSKIEKK